MRAKAIVRSRQASAFAAVLSLAAAIGLWLTAMAPRLAVQVMFGPICSGHGPAFAPHCPACYGAAVFLGLVLALGGWSLRRA